MEFDLVDAMAAAVIADQPGRMAVGLVPGGQRLRPPEPGAMGGEVALPGRRAFARPAARSAGSVS